VLVNYFRAGLLLGFTPWKVLNVVELCVFLFDKMTGRAQVAKVENRFILILHWSIATL
jgi:hypothetical protein